MTRRTVPLLALLLGGCGDAFTAPTAAYQFDPPAHFADLWARMEQCSGHSGDLRHITWYAVPDGPFQTEHGPHTTGLWVSPHHIYVAESSLVPKAWGSESMTVAHEMLHDLLQRGDHPPTFAACGA